TPRSAGCPSAAFPRTPDGRGRHCRERHAMLLVRSATIVTMNDALDVVEGDVLLDDGRIAAIGPDLEAPSGARVVSAGGDFLLPGFIQTHVHLCQTLFRGYADDLSLLPWLTTRVWPMEAAHTPRS